MTLHLGSTRSAIRPLLRSRLLRVLLIAAPGLMAAVGALTATGTATGSNLAWTLGLNAAAGIAISSAVFLGVTSVARRVADDRISLARATEEGHWRARTKLISIHNEDVGLYSDWYFRLRLREEIERAQRYGLEFTLLLTKQAGVHQEGDLETRTSGAWFSQRIDQHLRRSDLAAILKDGSLAVLLPHTKRDAALQRRLTKALSTDANGLGLACYPEDGEDTEALLQAAAEAARTSKHAA